MMESHLLLLVGCLTVVFGSGSLGLADDSSIDEWSSNVVDTSSFSEDEKRTLATMNLHMALSVNKCQLPVSRCLYVPSMYPGKNYSPNCAMLHRCEDSGCCKNPALKCHVARKEKVILHFFVLENNEVKLASLPLDNHTDCECQLAVYSSDGEFKPKKQFQKENNVCECPKPFTKAPSLHNKCLCDCNLKDLDCRKLKKGKKKLRPRDARCIKDGLCGMPQCLYGPYEPRRARCTRLKKDVRRRRTFDISKFL